MRASRRKRPLRALVPVAVVTCAAFGCTLFNSLDHLQSGLEEEDGSARGDAGGDVPGDARAPAVDGPDGAAVPGCGPEAWMGCGVTVVVSNRRPGGLAFSALGSGILYVTDQVSGEILATTCNGIGCSAPTVRVSGESAPGAVAFTSDSLVWTTPTAVRRLRPISDLAAVPSALDALTGPAALVAEYPYAAWTDDRGARACNVNNCEVETLAATPARSPAINAGFVFVTERTVKINDWDGFGTPSAPRVLPGSEGAELVTRATLFSATFEGRFGLVATLQRDGGTKVVVADAPDDAGAPRVLSDQAEAVRALVATPSHVYWTTASGELRRQAKDAPRYTTVLHGLGDDTALAVSEQGLVAIADRSRGTILTYAAP